MFQQTVFACCVSSHEKYQPRSQGSYLQPRPQGLHPDDFENGSLSGEDPVKAGSRGTKISKNLGDFYHEIFCPEIHTHISYGASNAGHLLAIVLL